MNYEYPDFQALPDPSHRPMYLAGVVQALRDLPQGASVLDAGCGGGDFSVGLAEAGFTVFGSDLSESGIAQSQRRGIGTFRLSSIYDPLAAPFGRETFDAIVCIEVIEHLYSPATFAAGAMQALPPGGLVVISTPYWGYLKNLVLALTNRTDRALTALWEGGHIKHFSRKTLTQLMTDAGFETVGFKGCGTGARGLVPGLWSGMLMTFRKPRR
ncbi:class I SAM-dependent methyltransferase [Novosphingobium sp.]|uniref:class I SAM-dependent methyltransferase n=1 Tax=Novosphingobium sp. TaxID=1874826 RepID=UPI0025EDB3A1|nr:class I SAM-dependent methyltransferase [Novosphingobium sp.]